MTETPGSGYWYGSSSAAATPRQVLEALRSYRAAEMAMRRRTRDAMHMNETDLAALRFVVRAERESRAVTPSSLMEYLGITMASVTVLIDRLERSGHLRREINPADRRSRIITATADAHGEVRATLDQMHSRMFEAVADLDPHDADVIVRFLTRMEFAVATIDAPAEHADPGPRDVSMSEPQPAAS